jgi:hypothetical protein
MFWASELGELLPKDKHDIKRATALVTKGYPAVAPILPELLEWMQDGNWPVAKALAPFLASIGEPLALHIRSILQTKDHLWKYWILLRIVSPSPELAATLYSDLLKVAENDSVDEDEQEVKEIAKEIISRS